MNREQFITEARRIADQEHVPRTSSFVAALVFNRNRSAIYVLIGRQNILIKFYAQHPGIRLDATGKIYTDLGVAFHYMHGEIEDKHYLALSEALLHFKTSYPQRVQSAFTEYVCESIYDRLWKAGFQGHWQQSPAQAEFENGNNMTSLNSAVLRKLQSEGIQYLYHFTDRSNICSIVETGGLISWADCEKRGIDIPKSGGSGDSRRFDVRKGFQDYVRLSFVPDIPMMHVAKGDGRTPNPVTLEIDVAIAAQHGVYFSDQNAVANVAQIESGMVGLNNVRFDILKKQKYQSDFEKSFWQAEVLVPNYVSGFHTYLRGHRIRAKTLNEYKK